MVCIKGMKLKNLKIKDYIKKINKNKGKNRFPFFIKKITKGKMSRWSRKWNFRKK